MNEAQAAQLIEYAFSVKGFAVPANYYADGVVEALKPYGYDSARRLIDGYINDGADPRDFSRIIERLRRESGNIELDDFDSKNVAGYRLQKEYDAIWQDVFGSAADIVRVFADEKVRKYRYRTFRYNHLAPSIKWHDEIMHAMRPAVGTTDLKVKHNAQNYVLEVLEITGVWRDRVLELAKKPYGDRTKTIGRKLNDDGEPSGMPEKVYSLLTNLSAQLKA